MFSKSFITVLTAFCITNPVSAFIRFPCANRVVEERADPVVTPGQVSPHVHKIAGGNGFGLSMDYDQARASKCSSCPIKQDSSNYWTPKLYYHGENGSFSAVPTVGDDLSDRNGGMTVYYLQRGPAADSKTLKAFPKEFRMVAGDPFKRSATTDFAGQAISFNCLGSGLPEGPSIPNVNCPSGLRAQVFFPSCWDGNNTDSPDHKSHMSYPSSGAYNDGPCPSTHPVQLISLFYEVLYDINLFASQWYGSSHPFVFAQGDPTGYGLHGDFFNGWDIPTLQNIIDNCDDLSQQGSIDADACPIIEQYTLAEQNACRLAPVVDEQVSGLLESLPGCNPVFAGPGEAPVSPTCSGQTQATAAAKVKAAAIGVTKFGNTTTTTTSAIANATSTTTATPETDFTDVTKSEGWAYIGCATDGDPRTFTGDSTLYNASAAANTTVENCIAFCTDSDKGPFTYAGLEYGTQCFCGNSISADRAPVEGILGDCSMNCSGDSSEICGGPMSLSVYEKCSSNSACQNAS